MEDYKFKIYGHKTERIVTYQGLTNYDAMATIVAEVEKYNGWYWDYKTNTTLKVVHVTEIHE